MSQDMNQIIAYVSLFFLLPLGFGVLVTVIAGLICWTIELVFGPPNQDRCAELHRENQTRIN